MKLGRGRRAQTCAAYKILGLVLLALIPFLDLLPTDPTSWISLFSEWEPPSAQHPTLMSTLMDFRLDNEDTFMEMDLWNPPNSDGWGPCGRKTGAPTVTSTDGYLQVFLEGGLNQQRMGVCDAVAVAKILNATLVIPHFDVNPVWQDESSFADIFDVDYFIQFLSSDVKILKTIPEEYAWSTREYYATGIRATRIKDAPVHARPSWYIKNVLPTLRSYGVVAIAPFTHRLAFEDVPLDIQQLRCKVNFQALRFVHSVTSVGDAIVARIRNGMPREEEAGGSYIKPTKFVALHLRFDKDMAAHSGCDFGGGKAERLALEYYRQQLWGGRVPNSRFSMHQLRALGKCPLTPEEAGLTLAALGFSNQTRVYLASYKVYGGDSRLSYLRSIFPLVQDKASLATEAELRPFKHRATLMAALDYYVCLKSDFFVSASPGNMHNAMIAHRTYLNVRKTMRLDMILLSRLFANSSLEWIEFRKQVIAGHKSRMGQVRLRQAKQSIYTYPAPDCMCKSASFRQATR